MVLYVDGFGININFDVRSIRDIKDEFLLLFVLIKNFV